MIHDGVFKEQVNILKAFILNSETPLRIFSKQSIEGLVSSAILIKTLQRLNKNFILSFYTEIDELKLREIRLMTNKELIFLDPSYLEIDSLDIFKDKTFFILNKNDISVSEKTYILSKELEVTNTDLAHLILLSESNLNNNNLLIEAEESKKVRQVRGIGILGSNTRPLHKTIEFSIEPFIVGFSGCEENSINLMKDLGFNLKTNDSWLSLQDLTDLQLKQLFNALSLNNYSEKEIIIKNLILNDEERNSPLRDVNEFRLFLESAIVYNKPSLAIAKLLLNPEYKNRALDLVKEYRQDIIAVLSPFYTRKDEIVVIEKENCTIVDFKQTISEIVLDKAVNLIQNSRLYPQKNRIIGLCQTKEDKLRCAIAFYNYQIDQNCKNFVSSLTEDIKLKKSHNPCILVECDLSSENKLKELLLDNLETTRIEEISQ